MCGTQERIPKALMYVELGLCDRSLLTILGLIMNVIEKTHTTVFEEWGSNCSCKFRKVSRNWPRASYTNLLTFNCIWTNHLFKNLKRVVHLWIWNPQTITTKATTQHSQLACLYYVFSDCHILCEFCYITYIVLAVGIVQTLICAQLQIHFNPSWLRVL